jgi:hypothetical protein
LSPAIRGKARRAYARRSGEESIFNDIGTSKETDLYSDGGEWAVSPRVSPDGRWLALYGALDGGKQAGLLAVPTAGGPLRMLDPQGIPDQSGARQQAPDVYANL